MPMNALANPRRRVGPYERVADPTPEEIAERSAEIRAGWSEVELRNRQRGGVGFCDRKDDNLLAFTIPVCRLVRKGVSR